MPPGLSNPKEMGRLVALAQVGAEMVVPIVVGVAVDHYWGWSPWGAIIGTVVGFGGGLLHLLAMLKRFEEIDASKRKPDAP
ncbi:MAG: AtpZ/AtpI family protein [Planctomycetia bacterium]|nr:AtpZ/AtpI family protein [Planctomycetia bacterium]